MNTASLKTSLSLSGYGIGTATDSGLTHPIDVRRTNSLSQGGTAGTLCNTFIDQATNTTTLAAGTATIDLQSFTDGLSVVAQSMVRVRVLYFEHDAASAASSITIFNAAGQSFQGPVSAGASVVLLPGERFDQESASAAGWAVDGTHHNLAIVVAGGTATLRYLVAGSTT